MRAHRSVTLSLLVVAFAMTGCYRHARGRASYTVSYSVPSEVVVQTEPPPVRQVADARPPAPGADAVWVEGHYEWDGGWVWVDGHWEPGHSGQVWVAPVATRRGGRVVYHPGHWRPASERPPPVYRDPGPVRVSVRRPPPPRDTQVRRPPPQGDTQVRRPPPQDDTQARRPPPRGTAGRRPPPRGTAGRRPPPQQQGGTTGRRPPRERDEGTVHRADDSVARARPSQTARGEQSGAQVHRPTETARGEQSGAQVHRPTETPRGEQGGSAPTRHPGVTARGEQSGAQGPAGRPSVQDPGRRGPAQAGERELRCSISTMRAPEGGYITITGVFGSNARVMIGGRNAAVANRAQGRIRAQVPGSSGGGMVRVVEGERSANCGTLEISSR